MSRTTIESGVKAPLHLIPIDAPFAVEQHRHRELLHGTGEALGGDQVRSDRIRAAGGNLGSRVDSGRRRSS